MKRRFFMIIGGCATGFTNDNFVPVLSCDQTTWKSVLRLEMSGLKLVETIDPFDNEPTISNVNIEMIDKDHFFNEIFTQKDNFCTLLTSQIDRADGVGNTFTVQDGSTLASSGNLWINNECIGYTRSGNTITIVKRAKFNSIKQTHETTDDSGNLSYIYDVMPEIIGRIIYLYKKEEDGTETLIFKGKIEPTISWKSGVITLSVSSFISILKNVSLIRKQTQLNLSHYCFIRPEQGYIQYQVTDYFEDGTIRRGWVKIAGLNFESIDQLLYSMSDAEYVDVISGSTFSTPLNYGFEDGKVKLMHRLQSHCGNKWTNGRFDFNGSGSEDILKMLGFEDNYVEFTRNSASDTESNKVVATNSPAAWGISYFSFGNWLETTIDPEIYIAETVVADNTLIFESDNQFEQEGKTLMALNIESFTSNIATLSVESVDGNHCYFSDNNESSVYLGKVVKGDFWNIIDNVDNLGDSLHPEFYTEADFDINSFKKLPGMTVFAPVWYLYGKVNLLDMMKNICKLSNFVLKISSAGLVEVQNINSYASDSIEFEFGNDFQIQQIAPLTTIKFVDQNETLIHEEHLRSKTLNYHTYPKVDQIKLVGLHNYRWGNIHDWLTTKAMSRFLIFARSLFQISFSVAESLVLGNTYSVSNELIPSFLNKVIITKKTYDISKGYEYEGILLGWEQSYYAPSCWVTSYNSGTLTGTCTSINNFSESTDLFNDLTYLDPDFYDETELVCIAYDRTHVYTVHVTAIDSATKTIVFKSGDTLPSAPFIVSFPFYDNIIAEMAVYAWICDEDDRKINDDVTGNSWS